MNQINLHLQDYYLGIIKCHPAYYEKQNRFIAGINMNPFVDLEKEDAVEIGFPTVVLKEGDTFWDIYYSRFKGELSYTLYRYNRNRILLVHVSPFLHYFEDLSSYPMMYTDTDNPYAMALQDALPYLIFEHPYGGEYIYINDLDTLDLFYDRFVNDFCIEDVDDLEKSKPQKITSTNPYSLENYFLGIIVCDEAYYKRPASARFIKDVCMDPFASVSFETARKDGVPTLLYKYGDVYYDIMWNRYNQEIQYQMDCFNYMGMKLTHVEPFLKWYPFPDMLKSPIITQVANNKEMREIQMQMPFLASYNPAMQYFDIELIDETPMQQMHFQFCQNKQKNPFTR